MQKVIWTGCEFTYRLKLAGSSTFCSLGRIFQNPLFFSQMLLCSSSSSSSSSTSLTKKQTSILPYSAKIFILPFSCWSFLKFFSHLSLKSKTLFVCLCFFSPPFALLCFPYLVSLSSFYCFCLPSVQSFLTAYPHLSISFFSFCTSAFLCIIHWFNWQSQKKKLPQNPHGKT